MHSCSRSGKQQHVRAMRQWRYSLHSLTAASAWVMKHLNTREAIRFMAHVEYSTQGLLYGGVYRAAKRPPGP